LAQSSTALRPEIKCQREDEIDTQHLEAFDPVALAVADYDLGGKHRPRDRRDRHDEEENVDGDETMARTVSRG
jgi:hypothetical protein